MIESEDWLRLTFSMRSTPPAYAAPAFKASSSRPSSTKYAIISFFVLGSLGSSSWPRGTGRPLMTAVLTRSSYADQGERTSTAYRINIKLDYRFIWDRIMTYPQHSNGLFQCHLFSIFLRSQSSFLDYCSHFGFWRKFLMYCRDLALSSWLFDRGLLLSFILLAIPGRGGRKCSIDPKGIITLSNGGACR
jgi:hypothetical protein